VAPEAGRNHLAGLRMRPDIPRQRQQRQRLLVIHVLRLPALGQAGALGLLAFAALDIGAEAAIAQGDLLAGIGILAEDGIAGGLRLRRLVALAELAGIAAFGIVRAADEG